MHPRECLRTRHRPTRRLVMAAIGIMLTVGVLPAVAGVVPGATAVTARASDITASQDTMRTGWDPNEAVTAMGPAVVPTFQQRFSTAVQGQVYAQPLVIDSLNMVIVATEDDWVYGIQATGPGAGTIMWSTQLGTPYAITSCGDLVPNIGVTGTPVYSDPAAGGTGDVYLVANVKNGTPAAVHTYLFGINPASNGAIVQQTRIQGSPSNDSHITYESPMQLERPGLLLAGGGVWAAFGSHCDHKPYTGYVARVDLSTQKVSLWTDESGLTNNQAGIWQAGGGIMEDPQGRIFVISGNGVSPTKGPGTSPPGQLAESVMNLAYNSSTGTISPQDFFSPANAPSLDASDTDFGAGGPVGLPFVTSGSHTYQDIMAATSKDGRIWVLNRNNLGGREQGPGGGDNSLFVIKSAGGDWGHPAVFADQPTLTPSNAAASNDLLFYVGANTTMQVFRFGVISNGKPTLSNVANGSLYNNFTSGSPVVTSSGTDPTSAVVWVVSSPKGSINTGANSVLTAYSLGPVAATGGNPSSCTSASPCTLKPIWTSPTFSSAKFSIPATSNGWVYVGTRDDRLIGFSAPGTAALAAASTATFPQTGVSSTTSKNVSITATKTVTVTGVTASTVASSAPAPGNQYAITQLTETKAGSSTQIPVTGTVTLSKGDKLTAQVAFTPAAPGGTSGTLSFATTSAAFPAVNVAMTGEGTQDGLFPQPSSQTFPLAPDQGVVPVPVGIQKPEVVNITNFGTTPQTVTSVTPPAAPFSATSLPSVGTTIQPGQTISVQVTFAPTTAGPAAGSFTIAGSSGTPATVGLSGVGATAVSEFSTTDPTVNFGTIPVGKQATAYVNISNTGNTASTVKGSAPVAAPFAAKLKPPAGMPFNPESDMTIPVTFTPTKKGTFSTPYKLTWTDVNGTHTLTVILTGTAV